MTIDELESLRQKRPSNVRCHDLTGDDVTVPEATKNLLGLGLKCCIAQKRMGPFVFDFERFTRDLRLRFHFRNAEQKKPTEPHLRKLYIKNKDYEPPEATHDLEQDLKTFEHEITSLSRHTRHSLPSLSDKEINSLKSLRDDPILLVLPTDKNLGPAILERRKYIEWVLREHLSDANTYKQIPDAKTATTIRLNALRQTLDLLSATLHPNSQDIQRYFLKAYGSTTPTATVLSNLINDHRLPQFYGMPKVHKQPHKIRPVISKAGNELEVLSKWLDSQLQRVVHLCPGYLRDNWELLRLLRDMKPLPKNSFFVTADAEAMYSNIDTDHGLETLDNWLKLHKQELPKDFPTETVIHGLAIVMKNNVFAFGDTFWLQLRGTAMGTSVACMYATVYYSFHEETAINTPDAGFNSTRILFNKRFIDDAIFIVTTDNTVSCKQELQLTMDNFKSKTGHSLRWGLTDLLKTVDFLDLTLTIEPSGRISSKTFQKAMNLYLYIPRMSAHPNSVFDSFITGQIRRFWLQNTYSHDLEHILGLFFERLVKRGYPRQELRKRFDTVKHQFSINPPKIPKPPKQPNTHAQPQNTTDTDNQLFLHTRYHPDSIPNKLIHETFSNTFQNQYTDDDTTQTHATSTLKKPFQRPKLTIAYSKAPNIGDLSVRTTLCQKEGHPRVSDYISRVRTPSVDANTRP